MLTKELILSKYPKYTNISEIKKLNIWGEDIEDISIISQMPNLEVLSLSSNKISSLFPLSYCLNLREIILRNNNIYSFDELYHLKNLPKLKELWLEGNPISQENFYIKKVLNILPKLHTLDNKNILLYKSRQKRGRSEEQILIKNSCDYNANIAASNKKKIYLRRVFSYFEQSSEGGGGYIETSNEGSIGQKKQKNDNYHVKRNDLSEFKIKFSTNIKSAKKGKNFKKIKLKLKNNSRINNRINNNLYNNNFMIMYNGPKISNRKLTVDTNLNIKQVKRDNITVQNSIMESKDPIDFKIKKLTLLGNRDRPNIINRYKNDEKISININNYENDNNNNNNMMKIVYSLVDKMNIQDLLNLKEFVDKKISFLNK